jgi:chromosome partitioning protein
MILAVLNNKGGTGKTTTSVNLSAAFAKLGKRVLLCDIDSQASASISLGVPYHQLAPGISELLFDDMPPGQCIRPTGTPGLDLITGGPQLASADLVMADIPGREGILGSSLDAFKEAYDFVVLDCAPSLSLLQVNAFTSCDYYIIPLTPEYLALEGLVSLLDAVEKIKRGIGITPRLMGILFTMVSAAPYPFLSRELRDQRDIIALVREQFQEQVFATIIRKDLNLAEAPSHGKSIFQHAPHARGAGEYSRLAEEIMKWL